MHTVPVRYRKGRQADDDAAVGRAVVARADAGDEGRLDLRTRQSRDEPGQTGAKAFSRGFDRLNACALSLHLVIPAKAGIQGHSLRPPTLDPRFREGDG